MSQTVATLKAEFEGDASQLKKTIGDVKGELNSVGKAGEAAGSDIAGSFLKLASVVGGVIAAAKIGKEIFDFSYEGSQIASLQMASQKLAMSYGTNMTSIVESVKDASFNTITEYEAMKAANLAMTMGVSTNAQQIGNLMEIAILRGRAFGLTTEEAFDRITRGIGRRSNKILDDLGFTTNAIEANKEYAASLGISTSALTDSQRVQAIFTQVLKQGNEELEKQGGLMIDVSTPYQQLTTKYKEFWQNAKMAAAYGLLPFIASPGDVRDINNEAAAIELLTGSYEDYIRAKMRAGGAYVDDSGLLVQPSAGALTESQFTTAQALGVTTTAQLNAYAISGQMANATITQDDAVEELNEDLILQAGLSRAVADAQEKYDEEMKKAHHSTKKQKVAVDNLNESYQDFMMSMMGSMGASATQQIAVAYAFGEMDDKSVSVFGAMSKLQDMVDQGIMTNEEYANAFLKIIGNIEELNGIELKGKSMTIGISVLVNGVRIGLSGKNATALFNAGLIGPGDLSMYGGAGISSIGLLHGGIIGAQNGISVSPGYGNDGMLMRVSSGERVDVTPAGNKTIENTALLAKLEELNWKFDGLPRAIRDAVQTIV